MKQLFNKKILLFYLLWLIVGGCAATQSINVRGLIKSGNSDTVHTACNIWYENPERIETINYQKGKILPFGTPVEILKAEYNEDSREDIVVFRTIDDSPVVFTLAHPRRFRREEDVLHNYVPYMFTAMSLEEMTKDKKDIIIDAMKSGKVVKGMTREEVIRTLGPPAKHRNPDYNGNSWIYWKEPDKKYRVIFKENKVNLIFEEE